MLAYLCTDAYQRVPLQMAVETHLAVLATVALYLILCIEVCPLLYDSHPCALLP